MRGICRQNRPEVVVLTVDAVSSAMLRSPINSHSMTLTKTPTDFVAGHIDAPDFEDIRIHKTNF